MSGRLRNTITLGLVTLSTTACPRRVEVESEPSRMESSSRSAQIDLAGDIETSDVRRVGNHHP